MLQFIDLIFDDIEKLRDIEIAEELAAKQNVAVEEEGDGDGEGGDGEGYRKRAKLDESKRLDRTDHHPKWSNHGYGDSKSRNMCFVCKVKKVTYKCSKCDRFLCQKDDGGESCWVKFHTHKNL